MSLTSSMEDYLEAVLVLQKQKGYARCVDVSEFLGVTKPSVSRAVKELSKKKCLLKKDDGTLSLTEQGQSIAKQIYEKHRFFTKEIDATPEEGRILFNFRKNRGWKKAKGE